MIVNCLYCIVDVVGGKTMMIDRGQDKSFKAFLVYELF